MINKYKEYIKRFLFRIDENIKTINIEQAERLLGQYTNVQLVDVRSPQEYAEWHRKEAILIPNYEMQVKAERILKNKNDYIILYCETGTRSKKSAKTLQKMGYINVYILE